MLKSRTVLVWTVCVLLPGLLPASYEDASDRIIEPVKGKNGMVVAGHPEATEIGLRVLKEGGNAIDAVVATSLALGVAEPYGSGLGGKCALLYYEAASGTVSFIDGMDTSGAAFDVTGVGALRAARRAQGGSAIGVPGLVAALSMAHGKWGKTAWSELVLPAAELAEGGFLVVPGMPVFFERRMARIQSHPETARLYLPKGQRPDAGERLSNPDLGKTLRAIAEQGRAGFYEGDVAERIVAEIRATGGHLTLEDFSRYAARLGTPLSVSTGGFEVFGGGPPTTGGATALLSLTALEMATWDLSAGFHSAPNLDLWARMLRHVYPRIQRSIADTPAALSNWQNLTDPAAINALRVAAGQSKAPLEGSRTSDSGGGWTTHFVVADGEGNVASVTQSLSHHFGSGVTAPGTGVVLNNSLTNFSYADTESVNYGAPNQRPRSTIAPIIILKEGRPVLAFGLPGGGRIPTTTLAILVDYLHFGQDIGQAIAAPRAHLFRSRSAQPDSNTVQLEANVPAKLAEELRDLGWDVEVVADTEFFGGVTALEIDADGQLTGWADARRTNHAAGF